MAESRNIRVRVTEERKEEIGVLAESIADEYCPTGLRVDPEKIIADKQLTLVFGRYDDAFDGMLEHEGGHFCVYCNLDRVEYRNAPRARFTLGHELGHYFIDEHRNELASGRVPKHPSQCDHESANPVEIEADHFASNLLMPKKRFAKRAARVAVGLPGILSLSSDFGTSITSSAIRYLELGPIPCAVLKWNEHGLSWGRMSQATIDAGFRGFNYSISTVPKDSPTYRALAEEAPPNAGFFQTGSTAACWFRGVSEESPRNEIIIEQAMRLGRWGVLTLLYPAATRWASTNGCSW